MFIGLTGCDYTQEKRQEFYKECVGEYINYAESIVDKMRISCACEQWSLGKDIRTRNKKVALKQYNEEKEKCHTTPMKHTNADQRRFCKEGFIKFSHSLADKWLHEGWSIDEIDSVGMWKPEVYERKLDKNAIDCACERLGLRYGFVIPSHDILLKKELDKEIKKYKEPPQWSQY